MNCANIRGTFRFAICCGASKKTHIKSIQLCTLEIFNGVSRHSILMSICVDIDIVVTYVTIRRHTKICLCFQCALSTRSTARHVTRLAAFIQPRPAVSLKVSVKGGLVENSFQFARELIRFHGGTVFPLRILYSRPPQTVTEPPRFLSHPQTSRVKNKIIKSRRRSLKLAPYVRDRRRRYLYSVRKYRRAESRRCVGPPRLTFILCPSECTSQLRFILPFLLFSGPPLRLILRTKSARLIYFAPSISNGGGIFHLLFSEYLNDARLPNVFAKARAAVCTRRI